MSILDYQDELDAKEARRIADSHGDSESMLAYRDRLDAEQAEKRVVLNQQNAAEREWRYSRRIPL